MIFCCGCTTLIARFMGPPFGANRTQVGPMLVPKTLLSGYACCILFAVEINPWARNSHDYFCSKIMMGPLFTWCRHQFCLSVKFNMLWLLYILDILANIRRTRRYLAKPVKSIGRNACGVSEGYVGPYVYSRLLWVKIGDICAPCMMMGLLICARWLFVHHEGDKYVTNNNGFVESS